MFSKNRLITIGMTIAIIAVINKASPLRPVKRLIN